jgi:hypothetical protein
MDGGRIPALGTSAIATNGSAQVRYVDGAADMQIVLQGLAGQILSASDFMFAAAGAGPLSAKDPAPEVMDPLPNCPRKT